MSSGIGTALQQAIGLGMAGARGLAEGLGLAQPQTQPGMFGAPAQAQQTDLGDLGLVQQLGLRFQNAVASSEGKGPAVASNALRDRRGAENQKRVQAYQQGVKMLQDFEGILDKTTPAEHDRVNELLRKRFGELAGGQPGEADGFYDTFLGGRTGISKALLEQAANDPGAQQIIAGGGTIADLRKYLTSEDKIKQAFDVTDQRGLPAARNKIQAIFNVQDPALRARVEQMRASGGGFTLGELRQLDADLPPDLRPTQSEWDMLERNELDLGDIELLSTPELAKMREEGRTSQNRRDEKAAEIAAQHAAKLEEIELEASLGKFAKGGAGGTTAQRRVFAKDVRTETKPYREQLEKLDQFLETPYNGTGGYQVLNGWISALDNTAAREGEVDVVRREATAMADRLRMYLSRFTSAQVIPESTFNEIKSLLAGSKERYARLYRKSIADNVQIGKSLFGEEAVDALIPRWREVLEGGEGGPDAGGDAPAPAAGAAAAAGGVPAGHVVIDFPDGSRKMVLESELPRWQVEIETWKAQNGGR
jgi:hypothetical protein